MCAKSFWTLVRIPFVIQLQHRLVNSREESGRMWACENPNTPGLKLGCSTATRPHLGHHGSTFKPKGHKLASHRAIQCKHGQCGCFFETSCCSLFDASHSVRRMVTPKGLTPDGSIMMATQKSVSRSCVQRENLHLHFQAISENCCSKTQHKPIFTQSGAFKSSRFY